MIKAADKPRSAYEKKLLVATTFGSGSESIVIMLISFVLSSIIADFHISSAIGGTISSITNMGMLIGGIVFGIAADKYGRAKLFKYTVIIFAIASLIIAASPNIYFMFVFRFIAGFGSGGEYGIMMSMITEEFAKDRRGKANSYVMVGAQVANILLAIAAAIILPLFGWRMMFVIVGIIPIPLVFYISRNLREPREWLEGRKKSGGKVSIKELFIDRRKTLTSILLIVMTSVQCCGYYGLVSWLPAILQKRMNLTAANSSLWSISIIVGICLGMLLFGRIMDKFGSIPCYAIFLIGSAISVFVYIYSVNPIIVLIGGIIVGFFTNGMGAGYGVLIGSFYPSTIRATANSSLFNAGRAIGGLSPIMIGFIMDKYSLNYVILSLSLLYIISFAALMGLRKLRPSGTAA